MQRLDSSLFTWSAWRANDFYSEFGVRVRHSIEAQELVRQKAIGYCVGESLPCRPKPNHYAVMFWDGEQEWWTHLTNEEFHNIFT